LKEEKTFAENNPPQEEQNEKDNPSALKEELDQAKNKLLRALADYDNLKKRSIQERQQFAQFANEMLIFELLPIIDGFDRAIESSKNNQEIMKGIALIKKQFEDILGKQGLKAVESLDKQFDPNFHEAILRKEDAGPEGKVIEEVQKGYCLHGKVIRPSMVIVSKKGEK